MFMSVDKSPMISFQMVFNYQNSRNSCFIRRVLSCEGEEKKKQPVKSQSTVTKKNDFQAGGFEYLKGMLFVFRREN